MSRRRTVPPAATAPRAALVLAGLAGLAGAILVVTLGAGVGPVGAAGGRLSPVRESYEPGDEATMVGYTGGPTLAVVPTVAFYAYLRPAAETGDLQPLDTDVPLGPLALQRTAHRGFLTLRASITFHVPDDLDAGEYVVWFCDNPCTRAPIGDLGPGSLAIGVAPARPVARAWAFDDPEIANLEPEALIVGADFQATAADVRAGRVAPPPEPPGAPAPEPPEQQVAPPKNDTMDWPLPTALMVVAAAGTWLVLSRWERACAPELATRPREAPGGGRNAAVGRG